MRSCEVERESRREGGRRDLEQEEEARPPQRLPHPACGRLAEAVVPADTHTHEVKRYHAY